MDDGALHISTFEPAMQRDVLHRSEIGLAEFCVFSEPDALVEGFTPNHQIALTLTGAFHWRALDNDKAVDPTRLLFILGGHEYRETLTDAGGGHSVIIATPSSDLIDEAGGDNPARLEPFRREIGAADAATKRAAMHLMRATDALERDEALVAYVRAALSSRLPSSSRGEHRAVRRARDLIAERFADRLSLAEIARACGSSPVYLAELFRAAHGMTIHNYQLSLRLASALGEIPHAGCLTSLALDLGFSSHSHFTSVFRRHFGVTPTQFRAGCRFAPRIEGKSTILRS